jgi:sugar phosphate isomerase/epimerase
VKVSCLPVSYFSDIIGGVMSVGQWAREAADIGLDAIDLSILFVESSATAYLKTMRSEIESAGMSVTMLTTYPNLTHPDKDERAKQASRLSEDIATAAALGASLVRVTAGQAHPETSRQDGLAWATAGLLEAIPAAEQCGVQLVFENHSKPGVWEYADFSYPPELFLAIAQAIRGTAIGINYDTANVLAYGDEPLPVLEQVIDQVVSVHAADTRIRGDLEPTVLGTGLVPFTDIFATLKRAGFDGWICIEEASQTGRVGIKTAVDFIRTTWAEADAEER